MSAPALTATSTRASRIGAIVGGVALCGLAAAPFFADAAWLSLLTQIFAYLALATLWNLLAGFSGLVSVGQHAWVGVGGYCLFGLTIFAGIPALAAIPIAGCLAALLALPVAGLLFRLRGSYFAIGSWVVAEVMRLLASQATALGGGSGLSLPTRVVLDIANSRQARESLVYWVSLAMTVLVLAGVVALLRSRWGLALRALHNNELAARASGVEVTKTRLLVYVLTAFATACIGALIFFAEAADIPGRRFQRQRLDGVRNFYHRDRRRRQAGGSVHWRHRVLCVAPDPGGFRLRLPDAARRRGDRRHAEGAAGVVGSAGGALRMGAPAAAAAGGLC